MITVAILINGHPLMARSATNTKTKDDEGRTIYKIDDGSFINHDPKDGVLPLAHLMLDKIDEETK